MGGGQNTQHALLVVFFLKMSKFTRFLEDQMNPTSAVGGPQLISRTGAVGLKKLMFETAVFLAIFY